MRKDTVMITTIQ